MRKSCSKDVFLFRAVPNIAISLRESLTSICTDCTEEKIREKVTFFFHSFGKVFFMDEILIDKAVVLFSSGTAFSLNYLRVMVLSATEAGFEPKEAVTAIAQTMMGAAKLVLENDEKNLQELIESVTTPGGCTIRGINGMEEHQFSKSVLMGVRKSIEKIEKK